MGFLFRPWAVPVLLYRAALFMVSFFLNFCHFLKGMSTKHQAAPIRTAASGIHSVQILASRTRQNAIRSFISHAPLLLRSCFTWSCIAFTHSFRYQGDAWPRTNKTSNSSPNVPPMGGVGWRWGTLGDVKGRNIYVFLYEGYRPPYSIFVWYPCGA